MLVCFKCDSKVSSIVGSKKVVHYMPSDRPLFRNTKAGWLNENFGRILVYEFLIFCSVGLVP